LLTAAVLAPLLAGCGSGFQAETNQIYQPGQGISVRDTAVYGVNMLIVSDGEGNGTLVGALINQAETTDRLVGASVRPTSGKALDTTIVPGRVPLPPHQAVQLADDGDVRITGKLLPGAYYVLTLTFHHAAPIETQVPVVPAAGDFADVPVGPVPTTGG